MDSQHSMRTAKFHLRGTEPGESWQETWQHCPALFCVACGREEVWTEDERVEHSLGTPYLCAACGARWTMPSGPEPAEGRDLERLEAIRGVGNGPQSQPPSDGSGNARTV